MRPLISDVSTRVNLNFGHLSYETTKWYRN